MVVIFSMEVNLGRTKKGKRNSCLCDLAKTKKSLQMWRLFLTKYSTTIQQQF
jgi:hypothetical protein